MRFRLKNIGPVDEAELELADLTIVCGENNTGKTCVVHAVHGFFEHWRHSFVDLLAGDLADGTIRYDSFGLDIGHLFFGKANEYLARISARYSADMPVTFSNRTAVDRTAEVIASVDQEADFAAKAYRRVLRVPQSEKVALAIHKEPGSTVLTVLTDDEAPRIGWQHVHIADAIASIVFEPYFPVVHISCAERTGAVLFRREFEVSRGRELADVQDVRPGNRLYSDVARSGE